MPVPGSAVEPGAVVGPVELSQLVDKIGQRSQNRRTDEEHDRRNPDVCINWSRSTSFV